VTPRRLSPALALLLAAPFARAGAPAANPSRPADKGCEWSRLSDPALGLELLAQKCDYGFRRIYFDSSAKKRAVYQVSRDSGTAVEDAVPVIWVYEKKADESPEQALQRLFVSKLSRTKRRHCVVQETTFAFFNGTGKRAYEIVPDDELAEESAREAQGDVPEPPCGGRGKSADGVSYFEFHPDENPRRFVFVDAGQDEHPMFDERSLLLLP
jgi:hypothetical protein